MVTAASLQTVRPLLEAMDRPAEVRRLSPGQLPALAAEIHSSLVGNMLAAGGHLGPNLGVVELTLALHRVFDVEAGDALLFDTDHQAYVHRLLTGRRAGFDVLRRAGCPVIRAGPSPRMTGWRTGTPRPPCRMRTGRPRPVDSPVTAPRWRWSGTRL